MRIILIVFFFLTISKSYSQDSLYLLKIHFLYGSKPHKNYVDTEGRWFGGKLGGHVGIQGDSSKILNFLPSGDFHVFGKKDNRHSTFAMHSINGFYSIFGGHPDSAKKAIFYVPITIEQKNRFDSIAINYLRQTPYDYAFFGMRCGAAAYEILSQLNIVKRYGIHKTSRKIFYPKKLRKRLFKKAIKNSWRVDRFDGSKRRKWEKD